MEEMSRDRCCRCEEDIGSDKKDVISIGGITSLLLFSRAPVMTKENKRQNLPGNRKKAETCKTTKKKKRLSGNPQDEQTLAINGAEAGKSTIRLKNIPCYFHGRKLSIVRSFLVFIAPLLLPK